MAQKIQKNLVQPVATPQHYVPSTARQVRVQAVHRLQIGLFGLAAMLLLVGLANIIMDRARLAEEATSAPPDPIASASPKAAADPLAEIGAMPAADPVASASPKAAADPLAEIGAMPSADPSGVAGIR